MISNSFYSNQELESIGFKSYGTNVNISKYARFYSPEKMIIGNNVRIDDFCILSGDIKLGSYVHIASFCALYGKNGIIMEDYSGLSSRVTIYSITDDYSGEFMTNPTIPSQYINCIGGTVHLMKHVIIGASSVVLPSLTLGEGVAVGALSLVTKNLKEWTINFGSPAKFLKTRQKNILDLEKQLNNIP